MNDKPSTSAFRNFADSFTDLARQPIALWFVIGAFVIDSSAYFGVLLLMTNYLSSGLGWGDKSAGLAVSLFTMLVTLFMIGVGSWAEKFGLRKAILTALVLAVMGRGLYCLAPGAGSGIMPMVLVIAGMLLVALNSGIIQPTCYSGVKQYTDEKTASMGYGLIYALMNLGIVGIAALSSWIRPGVQELVDRKSVAAPPNPVFEFLASFSNTGVQAMNWTCLGISVLTLLLFLLFMTRKVEACKVRPDAVNDSGARDARPILEKIKSFFADGPFGNPRFVFFIFMLLPVRTLFAHQWLTMPDYIMRAYPKGVADRMEWLVNWINPLIIFFGVPIITALTRKANIFNMMVIGSLVSAAPTFLLCFGPSLDLLITYFVVFSIGEALWSARFLEYASELAPPGKVAQYMGMAQIPWLLAKGTTGFYSGWMLANYCPKGAPVEQLETGTMWFVYGCVAMLSPIGLWLARGWVRAGLR